MKKFIFLIGFMVLFVLTQAQSFEELQKIYAADGSTSNHFGWSVDLGSNYLVVGQPEGYGGGAVYVFIKNNGSWIQLSKITASDTEGNNKFGESVSTDGEFILVGAPNKNAAYFYKAGNGTWEEQKIIGEANDHFGSSVAIYGNYALIGADSPGSSTNCHAFLFHYNGTLWEEVQELHNISALWFGKSVALTGNMAVIADNININLYNFSDDTLVYLTSLTYGSSEDEFGHSLDISDDYIVAGSWRSDENGNDAGSVYVFHKLANMWVLNQQLIPDDVSEGDRFGCSVAVSGEYLVVGALNDFDETDSTEQKGSAYIFHADENDNWQLVEKIIPSDADYHTFFGTSATILDGEIVVGAYGGDGISGYTGAAWYYYDPAVNVAEIEEYTPLTLFPVPAQNSITFMIDSDREDLYNYTVYDVFGKKVMSGITGRLLDVSQLSSGTYVVVLKSKEKTYKGKFVKY